MCFNLVQKIFKNKFEVKKSALLKRAEYKHETLRE